MLVWRLVEDKTDEGNIVTAEVEVVEPMGFEINLYLNIAEIDSESDVEVRDQMQFLFDLNKMHIFDVKTEKTVV
ncbi:hypothetical protein MWH25_06600 [Natroniella acetigena]|uniref:hypothetical protein n=1 Tax=Natroniella acetigena TaxID=52004 RepID=UPI00200A55E6|nr:hypothetical protein [Natroniella acetigena]MCK8827412.1 hypothetical protein [Natroniella acetigena]